MKDRQQKPVSLRERQREQTFNHLLDVAAQLIGTKGFNATSIDDLAKAAGASRATVYSYFDTKETIVEEITRVCWDNGEALYQAFGELSDWNRSTILEWLIRSVLAGWEHDRPLHQAARKGSTKVLESGYRDYLDRYIDCMTSNEALWQARFSRTEVRRRALMLISLLDSFMAKLFAFGLESDRVSVMETLADVICDVLHAQD